MSKAKTKAKTKAKAKAKTKTNFDIALFVVKNGVTFPRGNTTYLAFDVKDNPELQGLLGINHSIVKFDRHLERLQCSHNRVPPLRPTVFDKAVISTSTLNGELLVITIEVIGDHQATKGEMKPVMLNRVTVSPTGIMEFALKEDESVYKLLYGLPNPRIPQEDVKDMVGRHYDILWCFADSQSGEIRDLRQASWERTT